MRNPNFETTLSSKPTKIELESDSVVWSVTSDRSSHWAPPKVVEPLTVAFLLTDVEVLRFLYAIDRRTLTVRPPEEECCRLTGE